MQPDKKQLEQLTRQLDNLHTDAAALEKKFTAAIKKVHPSLRKSARNLLHYLALRQHDIRELQNDLVELGLSSLGRAEGHVLASLQAVRHQLCNQLACEAVKWQIPVTFAESKTLLSKHTKDLLGTTPPQRNTRIMVTFSSELATNYDLVCRLLKAGMNCARINCAHDAPATWLSMVKNIWQAKKEMNLPCRILMDLMGPKFRTGPLKPGPKLLLIQPVQDALGKITSPAKVWLAPEKDPAPIPVDASLPIDATWLAQMQENDKLYFTDTRGRKRSFSIIKKQNNGLIAHLFKSSYIATGTKLYVKDNAVNAQATAVGELPSIEVPIILHIGHFLELTKDPVPGEPAQYDASGHIVKPAHISCTLSEVFTQAKPGEPILFNDGKIEGEIQKVEASSLLVKITYASTSGSKLRADNGINLPQSKLHIKGLTAKDKQDLTFVAKHADIVNFSFVNDTDTLEAYLAELQKLKATHLGIMLKIETKEAFQNLPRLLLTSMKTYPTGVMIARGDLAVECGWQRLAEVQEEILWLCEAAHIPVVWATQVLESLAKKGRPSRAEITDAAMSQRADCVMLNKGPHVIQAVELLDGILTRMQTHQNKKTSMLRSLHVSELEDLAEEKTTEV